MTDANISLLTALLVMVIVFLLGYARAVMVRANRDDKTTKATVKPLRRTFWLSTCTVVKVGFLGGAAIGRAGPTAAATITPPGNLPAVASPGALRPDPQTAGAACSTF